MKKSVPYHDILMRSLQNPEQAVAYINVALEDCMGDDEESRKVLLEAFKNVAEAQGGIAKLAEKSGLGRESLYKTLSSKGNPKLSTLAAIAHAMGFNITLTLPEKR